MLILEHLSSHQMSLQRGINLRALAEKMGQCSGAEVRGICTEAGTYNPLTPPPCELSLAYLTFFAPIGMYALRERRQHVTQEDFEFAVAKVCLGRFCETITVSFDMLNFGTTGFEEEPGGEYVCQQVVLVIGPLYHFGSRCVSLYLSLSSCLLRFALPPASLRVGTLSEGIVSLSVVDYFSLVPFRRSVDSDELLELCMRLGKRPYSSVNVLA